MIYYVGYYDIPRNGKYVRSISPAAVRKMDYVIQALCELGENVTVVSPAITASQDTNTGLRTYVETIGENCQLICAPMLPIHHAKGRANAGQLAL